MWSPTRTTPPWWLAIIAFLVYTTVAFVVPSVRFEFDEFAPGPVTAGEEGQVIGDDRRRDDRDARLSSATRQSSLPSFARTPTAARPSG